MKKFNKIYLEITNTCNLDCNFCPKTGRKLLFMEPRVFREILPKLQGRTRFLYLHVLGEPLLHPYLPLFLKICHEYGFKVNITTNGTLISKASTFLLREPALRQVNFSLHSFEANEGVGTMEEYLNDIFEFIQQAQEQSNLQISLRLWNMKSDTSNVNNQLILNKIRKMFGVTETILQELSPVAGLKVSRNVFLNQAALFKWPDLRDDVIGETGTCLGLREQIAILADGTVVPCCLDGEGAMALGNILDQSLNEIIYGQRAQNVMKGFAHRRIVEPLCQRCSFRQRFHG